MALKLKLVDPVGSIPGLLAQRRWIAGSTAPTQSLQWDRLLNGGTLSGPVFECRPGPFCRLWRRLMRL